MFQHDLPDIWNTYGIAAALARRRGPGTGAGAGIAARRGKRRLAPAKRAAIASAATLRYRMEPVCNLGYINVAKDGENSLLGLQCGKPYLLQGN
jgi:methyl coenzyme M reductase subunit C